MTRNMPGRIVGQPQLKEGNVKHITVDYKTMAVEFLQELGWDINTTVPSQQSLRKLGLDFLIEDMKKVSVKSI
jgi:aldehyde:ferredoxin oxidoreductase